MGGFFFAEEAIRTRSERCSAQARIIEKEKVLTNMQEHLAHIQELEAERAAKHQEKRDKAKQKVRGPRGHRTSIVLQRGVSRRVGAVRLSPRGCVGRSGVVAAFGPLRGPRCRASDATALTR